MNVPAFRRSWWGYSVKEVDRYLREIAEERQRLETSLTRVETMMGEWQCGPEPILAAAHREAAEIRAAARRDFSTSVPGGISEPRNLAEPVTIPEPRGAEPRSIEPRTVLDPRGLLDPRSTPEQPRIPEMRSSTEVRSAPDLRAGPREVRTAAKPDTKVQVISLTPQQREFGAPGDPNLPTPRFPSFRSADVSVPGPSDFMPERDLTESDLNAIEALERNRAGRQRRTRRMLALVGSGVSVLAAIAFAFSDPAAKSASEGSPARKTAAARQGASAGKPEGKAAATAEAAAKAGARGPATQQTLMLTISALKPCWIRTVVDGGQQMERVLQTNDTVMLHATNEVLLKVGDASALALLVNNRPIKPLGRSGEVVTQLITRANYASLLQPES